MNQSGENPQNKNKRIHDVAPSEVFANFMKSGWALTPLTDISIAPAVPYAKKRRAELSARFKGIRLVLPSGNYKVRSNDTNYPYRPHTAFAYYTGVQGVEATADAVLVMEPNASGHDAILFLRPRSTRDTDAFYRDAKYGELWVGRRFTLDEARQRWDIETRAVDDLEAFLKDGKESAVIRDEDWLVDNTVAEHERDKALVEFVSEHRLIKDEYEKAEMQRAVLATERGFDDMVRAIPTALKSDRGERVIEGAFANRSRIEGHGTGYESIVAAGSHACVLHWIRNDGNLKSGELILIDAGIELDSYYTADITRTLPVNGKYSPEQRALYMLVYEAQLAGFSAIKPGAKFSDVNAAAQKVLAHGLAELGVLTVSAEESLKPEVGLHRRWTLHGTSHHLGIDVHDCAQARKEMYMEAELKEGMCFTVEPGLYIQPDDELFAPKYRGIGIRIEDDIIVTKDGCQILGANLPRHPDEIEKWMAGLLA